MTMVESLHGRGGDAPPERALAEVADAVQTWGRDTLTEAFMLLIGVGVSTLRPSAEEPDVRYRLVGGIVHRFHDMQMPEVPDSVLPTVAGGLAAAVVGLDTYEWRVSLGPIPARETLVWCYAAWLLVELLDDVLGAGVFGGIVKSIVSEGDDDGPVGAFV